jgi:hypothetical protein
MQKLNTFGIDTYTKGCKSLVRRLNSLKTTGIAEQGGVYREEPSLCQVIVSTTWTEDQLDDWLWRTKGIDYIGIFNALGYS